MLLIVLVMVMVANYFGARAGGAEGDDAAGAADDVGGWSPRAASLVL